MSDKLRVHTLSKALGVPSKVIIEKCKMEGVEGVTNHMSTVSAGLAETIREWFSEESHGTAVEEAAPVDLKKVRTRRKPSRKKKASTTESQEDGGTTTAVQEPETEATEQAAAPAEAPEIKRPEPGRKPKAAPAEPIPTEPVVTEGGPVETRAEPIETPPPPPEQESLKPAAKAPEPPPGPPRREVRPAGPQNVPRPAQMRGPKVVGFAKPDPVTRPTPRPSYRQQPSSEPMPPTEEAGGARKGRARADKDAAPGKGRRGRANPRRSTGSLAEVGERLQEWRDRDLLERQERLEAATGRGIHARRAREKKTGSSPAHVAPRKTQAQIEEPIVLHELCAVTGIGMAQLMPKLMRDHGLGMVNRNTILPTDVAQVVMLEFGVELGVVKPRTQLDRLREEFAAMERKNLQPRPPVVTMLGHVDHGKTSLLDAIRATSVAEGEAGGITQHIGAYQVERGDLKVTFLDTPGHEAFTAMRARGAHMTDVVVLVVAADDGVMPQTVEAINHAKAAGVTIIVAMNKIDLDGVDLNKVYGQLSEHDLAPSEWGGETDVVKTSATTGQGIEALVDHLAVLSELLDLKADPTLPATGAVIEAQMQQGVGALTRVLVKEGTLKQGDFVVCGGGAGRVRMMRDDRGRSIPSATPGMPIEFAGLDDVPRAGDTFFVVDSLQRAKQVAEETQNRLRDESLAKVQKVTTLEGLFKQREQGTVPELNLILRADVQGSLDALMSSLSEIPSDEVKLTFLHTGVGGVTESDVVLASASDALIVGFNVTADTQAQRLAESEGVDIRTYRIIYDILDDVRGALEGLLPKDRREQDRGKAEVREIFNVSKVGTVAGCIVQEGSISRTNNVRIIRDGQIILPSEDDVKKGRHRAIGSLRRFKEDVREVRAGSECGIHVEGFDDVKPGDMIQVYEVIETARKL